MIHTNEDLDRITGKLVMQSGTEEPSGLFTERVMQSVLAAKAPVKTTSFNYYWLLLTIPVIIAVILYLTVSPVLMNKFVKFLDPIILLIQSSASFIMNFIHRLLDISVSPMVLIGSFAALSVLVIESLFTMKKHQL
jgi:hypothetical protein